MEALSLIDVSGEDDFLLDLASPPQHPDPPTPAAPGRSVVGADLEQPAGGSPAAGQVLDPSGVAEQVPERTESPKKKKPKGGVNLRKSLAWDSAFFTGEGVLDTEELGIVNSTFRKAQGSRLLPGIAEEMRRSTESTTSTLESESFVLESFETELFHNVRASIQRTLGKPDKAPGVTSASSKNSKATAKARPVTARKGVDRIPQTQSKIRPPVSTSNGCVGSKQRPQVTPKEPTVARVALSRAPEVKPSSKPPRALPRVATMGAPTNTAATSGISDKRSSTGGAVNRQTVGKCANTSASMSSRPGWGTKTSSTTKSGALSSLVISSSHSAPMGTMPGAKAKSPTLIGKTRTAQRIPIRSSSRSDISKVGQARASRNKIPTRNHSEGASPIISPSSSVDSMSSVISGASTASTVGKASHTSESFSTRSSSLSPSIRKSNDQPPTTKQRPLTVTEGTPCDNLKSNIDTSTQGNSFKPSGLRRPTPKIGYFDAEKSVEPKAARVQLQSTNVLFSPLATPNPRISSTPKTNFEFSTSDQQELKSMAAALSQTKALPSLPLRVAQTEVKPSKRAEHEASQIKASTSLSLRVAETEVESSKVTEHESSHTELSTSLPLRVAETEVESSKVTEHESSHTEPSPSLPLRVAETEVDPSKAMEHEASQTEASPSLPLAVAPTQVEPSQVMEHEASQINASTSLPLTVAETEVESSKVTEHEASHTEPSPSLPLRVAQTEVDPSKAMEHEASQTEASPLMPLRVAQTEVEPSEMMEHEASQTEASPSLPLRVAQTEVEEPSKVTEHEASQTEVEPSKVTEHEASETEAPPLLPVTVAQTEVEPFKGSQHEPSQTKASSSLPLRVAQIEVEPSKVTEHEAHMCEASPLVAVDIAEESIPVLDQNIQANGNGSPSTVELSSFTIDQQESETAAPGEESSPSQTNVAEMEVEPSEVIDHEACVPQACSVFAAVDNAKENIPALHQNIQPSGAPSPLKENILASHQNIQAKVAMTPVKGSISASDPNMQAIGDMTPVTLLSQKLSSISLTIDQQESETAAPGEESSPSQTNVAEMEVEPSEVIDHEACVPQACSVFAAVDNAKENIPSLHQNIQPSGAPSPLLKENIVASHQNIQAKVAMTPVKGNISASHPNMQAIGDMTPVTLLSQKLSSISLGAANQEATPLTLLAQKLSSISLGDATD